MTAHRASTVAALTALVVLLLVVPVAAASSLLSGYGGPGQGNQAILGSTLLNTPGGGSGGGSGSGGSAGAGGGSASASGEAAPTSAGNGAGSTRSARRARKNRASESGARPYTSRRLPTRISPANSETLGLTGADLIYILLVVGALAVTGALTTWFARQSSRGPRAG
jgi:hypothetical protein